MLQSNQEKKVQITVDSLGSSTSEWSETPRVNTYKCLKGIRENSVDLYAL